MCSVLNERYDLGFNTGEHHGYLRINKHFVVLSMNIALPCWAIIRVIDHISQLFNILLTPFRLFWYLLSCIIKVSTD